MPDANLYYPFAPRRSRLENPGLHEAGSAERCATKAQRSAHLDSLSFSGRSEEHTSELQSHVNLVCRLLLEKKNNTTLGSTRACPTTSRSSRASGVPLAST